MRLMRFAASAAVIAALAAPAAGAFAQTTTSSYYIVQNVKTRHCTVMSQRPTEATTTVVGPDGVVYKTRTEAMNAMKTVKVCSSD